MSDYPYPRTLEVPSLRPEPAVRLGAISLMTSLGLAHLWLSFEDEPAPTKCGLRGQATLHRVDYDFELELVRDGGRLEILGQQLRRRDWLRSGKSQYASNAAWESYRAEQPAMLGLVERWLADSPEQVYGEYLRSLESRAYFLEREVNRDADELEEKLAVLAAVHAKIASAEGQVKLEAETRSRTSALAS